MLSSKSIAIYTLKVFSSFLLSYNNYNSYLGKNEIDFISQVINIKHISLEKYTSHMGKYPVINL